MADRVKSFFNNAFCSVPTKYADSFRQDSLEKNVRRFAVLPFFNIFTQFFCIFVYLYMYPMVYPERKQIDAGVFLGYSALYCAINILAAVLFLYYRNPIRLAERATLVDRLVNCYIMSYVVLEACQVAIELEISGNVYRFLSTFFIVSFFPVVGRLKRLLYMASYITISELALFYLKSNGVNIFGYAEINVIVFVVCLVASNIYHNNVVRNFVLRKKLEFLSMNDELTGLANRRSLNQYVDQCWNTSIRSGNPIGILMIDIDYFKRYNDTYGHQAGDTCLLTVAEAIKSCFDRSTDLCARYGGEEFVVVIAHAEPEGATLMAERVRSTIQALQLPHTGSPFAVVTCSVGVAVETPQLGRTHEGMLKDADDALYAAKTAGRNCIQVYSDMDCGEK